VKTSQRPFYIRLAPFVLSWIRVHLVTSSSALGSWNSQTHEIGKMEGLGLKTDPSGSSGEEGCKTLPAMDASRHCAAHRLECRGWGLEDGVVAGVLIWIRKPDQSLNVGEYRRLRVRGTITSVDGPRAVRSAYSSSRLSLGAAILIEYSCMSR